MAKRRKIFRFIHNKVFQYPDGYELNIPLKIIHSILFPGLALARLVNNYSGYDASRDEVIFAGRRMSRKRFIELSRDDRNKRESK